MSLKTPQSRAKRSLQSFRSPLSPLLDNCFWLGEEFSPRFQWILPSGCPTLYFALFTPWCHFIEKNKSRQLSQGIWTRKMVLTLQAERNLALWLSKRAPNWAIASDTRTRVGFAEACFLANWSPTTCRNENIQSPSDSKPLNSAPHLGLGLDFWRGKPQCVWKSDVKEQTAGCYPAT